MTDQSLTTQTQPKPTVRAGGTMGALIPRDVEETFRLAEGLVKGGGAPKGVNAMEAFTIIAKGLEVGFAPLQALSTIANINGKLAIYGDGLVAIARRGGNKVHEEVDGNGEARVATCTITRADTGETITRTFSVQDAKRARLWGKTGPWSLYPDRMLAARARGYAIKDGLGDQLFGLHVAEDVQDIEPQADPTAPAAPGEDASRLQRRLGTVVAESAPEPEGESDALPKVREEPPAPVTSVERGLEAARRGRDALAEFWDSLTEAEREELAERHDAVWAEIARQADLAAGEAELFNLTQNETDERSAA